MARSGLWGEGSSNAPSYPAPLFFGGDGDISDALFRYGPVAQIIAYPPGRERNAIIAALAAKPHTIPGSTRTRVAEGTLVDWVRNYEHKGYDGLLPKKRGDRTQPRQIWPAGTPDANDQKGPGLLRG